VPDGFEVDDSELRQFAADLGEVRPIAGRFVRAAVEVSARHVKDMWRDDAKGQLGVSKFPYSITYDINTRASLTGSVVEAEIGPDKSRRGLQAALGNLVEFGGARAGGLSSRIGTGAAALERTRDDFEQGLSKALEDTERAAGVA